jgi:alkanesulfonate monooxygenase SsuD/methylene tetrahydromethanopterin reductase-like flavin-dependent oxidoreductase (luciferase family)
VKFLAITLIVHAPDPVTGVRKSTQDRFREVIGNALLAEELGFDGFGVGERHERPFISSSPPVVLSHLAALTRRIRLFTAVTTLSLLDPVRAYEDYATLDHLSQGRLELIIGKGNGTAQRELFHVTPEDQWDRNAESYEVFRRIWRQDKVTYPTRFRPELTGAEVWPRPLQQPVRVWHGSATSRPRSARARPASTPPAPRRRRSPPTGRSSRAIWPSRSSSASNRSSPPWRTSSSAAPR